MPSPRLPRPAAASFAVVVAVVVGGGGVLGGCQSEAMPTTSGSEAASPSATSGSPSPSVSPSPSTSPPVEIPAAAREKSDQGAEAFVRYFFDQVNTAWTTPRAGLIVALSDEGCQFCLKSEADAADLVRAGERYASAPITVGSVTVLSGAAPKGQSFVRTSATQNRVDVLGKGNAVVRSDKKKALRLTTGLIWKGGQWYVYEVEAG
jgi:Family of unknown function (DUF6318)